MSFEPVPGMRSTITDDSDGLTILMPARRVPFALFFLPVWIIGWAIGWFFAFRQLTTSNDGGQFGTAFLGVWISFWTIGGLVAITSWLWMMFGRERLVLGQGRLAHRFELFGFQVPREFDVQSIRNLRATPNVMTNSQSPFGAVGIGSGAIAFDYGAKTLRVGGGLEEAEGAMIVKRIKDRGAIPNLEG